MLEEEFYATIKFKNGEEVFTKVTVCDEDSIFLILLHPMIVTEIKERSKSIGFKVEPWLKTSSDDTFIVYLNDIMTISESDNSDMIMAYKSYVRQVTKNKNVNSRINRKMGYIGSIDEAKRDKELAELNKKFERLSEEYSEALNMEINYQEGAKLCEVVPRITSAITGQTEKLFGKK